MNPETLREHAKTIRLTYAFPDRLNEAADAWDADLSEWHKDLDRWCECITALQDVRTRLEAAERLLMEYHDGDWDTVDRQLAALAGKG